MQKVDPRKINKFTSSNALTQRRGQNASPRLVRRDRPSDVSMKGFLTPSSLFQDGNPCLQMARPTSERETSFPLVSADNWKMDKEPSVGEAAALSYKIDSCKRVTSPDSRLS